MADRYENVDSFGSWVRHRRKVLDLTQAALAQRVGCAEVTIRKIEANKARTSQAMAERLALCLNIPPDQGAIFLQVATGQGSVAWLPNPLTGLALPASTLPGKSLSGQALPHNTVPAPAPLPPGSRMPLSRNPLFVGRDADLRQLARAFTDSRTAAIGQVEIAAATGLGGIGKTQLACEFVHRYGQYFAGGVFWLNFADPAAVAAEVAACGGTDAMDLRDKFDALPLNEQVKLVLAAWAGPHPRLLVFDNCEDEALFQKWRPTHGGCSVLITSRRHHWSAALGVHMFPLHVLHRADSLALLCSFHPDFLTDDADLAAIAEILGDLPLALHLAGSFLAKYRHALTPAQYLTRVCTPTLLDDRSLQAAGISPTKHVQHVARTFEQSYEQLDPADPKDVLARTLLVHASFFAPGDPLPRWLLLRTLSFLDEEVDDALVAEDALIRLIDLGLLETDARGSLRMHRLVAAFAQAVLGHTAAQVTVEKTMIRVAHDINNGRDPRPLLVIQTHLRFITDKALARADADAAELSYALSQHLFQLGVYAEAQRYQEQALMIQQRVLGPEHLHTTHSLSQLGILFMVQGQYAAAQSYLEQTLAIQQRVFGPDDLDTAGTLNNLGGIHWEQGQYAVAQRYLEQALAIQQQVLGPDHFDTVRSLSNLSLLLQAQGQHAGAQRYLEQALALRVQLFGPDHPDVAVGFYNLGLVLLAQEQYAAAQHAYEQALAIYQRVFGPDHPNTAHSLNKLGEIFHAQRQYAAAYDSYTRALAIYQRVLDPDHPETAICLRGLGRLLHAQGQVAQARHYLEQALNIFERKLEPNHPDIEQTRQILMTLDTTSFQL